jgi:hypothetical protein
VSAVTSHRLLILDRPRHDEDIHRWLVADDGDRPGEQLLGGPLACEVVADPGESFQHAVIALEASGPGESSPGPLAITSAA